MKEIKLLDRVQAVLHLYIISILAAIPEHALKSKLTNNNFCQISLIFGLNVFIKSVKVNLLHSEPAIVMSNFLEYYFDQFLNEGRRMGRVKT